MKKPDAIFIGWQDLGDGTQIPLFNVTRRNHPNFNSSRTIQGLREIGLQVPWPFRRPMRRFEFEDGQIVSASFGFAEGTEPITVFWKFPGRYFCRQCHIVNESRGYWEFMAIKGKEGKK